MSRHVVVRENQHPFPGTFIAKGCFKVGDRAFIPVTYTDPSTGVIGRATDFQRNEETNQISFEIEWQDPNFEAAEEDYFSVRGVNLVEDRIGDDRIVTEATIVQIVYFPFGGIPKAISRESQGL